MNYKKFMNSAWLVAAIPMLFQIVILAPIFYLMMLYVKGIAFIFKFITKSLWKLILWESEVNKRKALEKKNDQIN
ncbi:hypothetical protein [Bacillus sp. UMB0728]|uniref:hypothetical protein n=1 Tax=Bacillus sp. UMB0728 TaxID=2066052 RepID=UPI000C7581C6|nr:hypothetical protein [Bacillus sp. UMB0728]PLR72264.1 hypothetical protein CYJ37_11960 [Bacillus sp. UMB0728]